MFESIVIRPFICKDTKKPYSLRDTYSHEKAARVSHLMDEGFLQKKDLKQEPEADKVETTELEPEHIGGGYYKLPNGDKVQGKKAALEAMKEV
jgi:hypothetical protein